MGPPRPPRSFALAIWFGALALLGALRFAMKLARVGVEGLDAAAWAWLAGALLLALLAGALAWREARAR